MLKRMKPIIYLGILISIVGFQNLINRNDVDYKSILSNSVVKISVYTDKNGLPSSQGSGTAIDNNLILTNYHVVKYPQKIVIEKNNGQQFLAEIKAYDLKSDLAILSTNADLIGIPFNTGKVVKGQKVAVVHKGGIENGYIKAINDSVPGYFGSVLKYLTINGIHSEHGSSGAPIIDSKGSLIGILSARFKEKEIINTYAIPIRDADNIIKSLVTLGKYNHVILGIEANELGENNSRNQGLIVSKVHENTRSYKKLENGDIINKVNNVSVRTLSDFSYELFKSAAKQKINLNIIRNGKNVIIKV